MESLQSHSTAVGLIIRRMGPETRVGTRVWGLRTDRGSFCQILDIIRFNDPSWISSSFSPTLPFSLSPFPLVYFGSCRFSGCCHGGSLSSSLTSVTPFKPPERLYSCARLDHAECPRSDHCFRGTTAPRSPLYARLCAYVQRQHS